jgi:hypothetical protein
MTTPTLLRQASSLAKPAHQVQILETRAAESIPDFDEVLARLGLPLLRAEGIEVLQVNVGKVCNQTCAHCHVDAGPDRREAMNRDTAEACVRVLAESDIATLDITGGAPEMNPHFRYLVREARRRGRKVVFRHHVSLSPWGDDFALRRTPRTSRRPSPQTLQAKGPCRGRNLLRPASVRCGLGEPPVDTMRIPPPPDSGLVR